LIRKLFFCFIVFLFNMNVIEVENLKKYFGKTKAVDGISFEVKKGEIFGFLGPNGAGKTTAIRCMMDFIKPTSGSIKILDRDAQKDSVFLKEKIGYLSGTVRLYDRWTGKEHIDFIKELNGKNNIANDLIKRLDFDANVRAKSLSSGNKQKLGIIMALLCNPEVLILDEPTMALDPIMQHEVYHIIKEQSEKGTTIFMSSHNLAEVQKICHRIGIIKNGKMAAMEDIATLRQKSMYTMNINFENQVDSDDFKLDGVEIIKALPNEITLGIKGDLNPIIKKISNYKIKDLDIEPASLEEIFLEYYG